MVDLELETNAEKLIDMIYTIRGQQVMFDRDLAEIYQVETRVLNQAVKRNIERFPDKFRFQPTKQELENLLSQIVIPSSEHGGRRNPPFVFTEQGVSMLSAVLRSETAIKVSIQIINAFVEMRKNISNFNGLYQRMDRIEQKQLIADDKFERIFNALEAGDIKPNQGIFYNGQIFDAYCFLSDLIKTAKHSIIVVDNYVDESVFTLLLKRNIGVETTIYVKNISKQLALDLKKYNEQYDNIAIKEFNSSHDRFLILDKSDIYHFGASLKDLGKKWFAFSKLGIPVQDILDKLT
jgi:phage regulator Rha-like protein